MLILIFSLSCYLPYLLEHSKFSAMVPQPTTPVPECLTESSAICSSKSFLLNRSHVDQYLIIFRQSLPAVSSVTTANFEDFKQADKIVAIAFVSDSTEAPPAFAAAAEKHRDDYLFGYSTDSELFAEADVSPPAIVLYRKFDEPKLLYPGDVASVTAEDIEQFIKKHEIPYVDEVGPDNYQRYVSSGLPLAYFFADVNDADLIAEHTEYLTALAKEFQGKINFVTIDSTRFTDHAKALNVKGDKWPAFVIQEVGKQLKYPLDHTLEVNGETVSDLVRRYIAGEVTPSLKSQPVPTQNESVYTVVSSEFEKVAADVNKDVFIEFYAPWCVSFCMQATSTRWKFLKQVWTLQTLKANMGFSW